MRHANGDNLLTWALLNKSEPFLLKLLRHPDFEDIKENNIDIFISSSERWLDLVDQLCQTNKSPVFDAITDLKHPLFDKIPQAQNSLYLLWNSANPTALEKLSTNPVFKLNLSLVETLLGDAAITNNTALILTLCELKGDNKPRTDATSRALTGLAKKENLAAVFAVCNLPEDQRPILATMSSLMLGNTGICISNICLENTNGTTDELLIYAADKGEWDIASKICALTGGNKPSVEAVNQALMVARASRHRKAFQAICAATGDIPDQNALLAVMLDTSCDIALWIAHQHKQNPWIADPMLSLAIKKKMWEAIRKLCALTGDNKPGIDLVIQALRAAAQEHDLLTVQAICSMTGDNKPDQNAISGILTGTGTAWEIVFWVCQNCKLNPGIVEHVLSLAAKKNIWRAVRTLCAISGEGKPGIQAVNQALRSAAIARDILTVQAICTMTVDNKPAQNAILDAMLNTSWEILLWIYHHHKHIPGIADQVLGSASQQGRWEVVREFCALTDDNKPNTAAVSQALIAAAIAQDLLTIQVIFAMTGDNKPDQNAIFGAMLNTSWDIVLWIYHHHKHTPGIVDQVLSIASQQDRWGDVREFCALTGDNKPSIEAINVTLMSAAIAQDFLTVQTICTMTGDNKPDQNAISNILLEADTTWKIILWLCHHCKLNPGTSDEILERAATSKAWWAVRELCAITNENKPGTVAINRAQGIMNATMHITASPATSSSSSSFFSLEPTGKGPIMYPSSSPVMKM